MSEGGTEDESAVLYVVLCLTLIAVYAVIEVEVTGSNRQMWRLGYRYW